MGKMESESRKRRRKGYVEHAVLGVIGVTGVLAAAMIMPNAFQYLPSLMGKQRYRLVFQAKTAIKKLEIKGYIKWIERNGKRFVEITPEGQRTLQLEQAKAAGAKLKKKRWDQRYRMVIFDIPERRRGVRERLRRMMREFGFLRLQNSVWIYPYDCEELVALVKAELKIGKDVLYVIADTIENDAWIKRHFKLA